MIRRQTIRRASWLSLVLAAIWIVAAAAQDLQPTGNWIGRTRRGHAIYQVETNGIAIGYQLIGTGNPLVLLPGMGGTMERWPRKLVEALARRQQLILLDYRGMGRSTADDTPFSYRLFAADAVALLDALGVDRTDVLGFSMGGAVAQELLLAYPDRIDQAILLATSTDGSRVAAKLGGRRDTQSVRGRQMEATGQWRAPLEQLPAVTNPVLVVVGTADAVVNVACSRELAAALPKGRLVLFPKGRHLLMYDHSAELARLILEFLDEPPASAE